MAGERRVGKRLAERLRWLRETPGADTHGPEAWEAEAARCRADGDEPPDRAAWLAASRDAGWEPLDDLHVDLLRYERLRASLGDAAVEGPCGPVVAWPAGWGAWSLAEHRETIARHWDELEAIRAEERRR